MKSFVALVAALALLAAAGAKSSPLPASPPASCDRQCLTWRATVVNTHPLHKANCTADAIKYFRKRFVPDVSRVMEHQGGPVSKFTKAAKKWKATRCEEGIADNFEERIATNVVTIEICGAVPADVGPALAKAVAYATWKGKTSLEAHAKAMTGFRTLPASTCFNHSLTAAGANDEPQCALDWYRRCTDATPSPSPSPSPSPLPPPPSWRSFPVSRGQNVPPTSPARPKVAASPLPYCTQECIKWTTAVMSAKPDLSSTCNAALGYFAKTFVPDLQRSISSPAARAQFALDAANWSVKECSIQETSMVVEVCGSVSKAKAVGAAVASAAEAWNGTTSLDTHARVITGFSSLPAGSCVEATMKVYGLDNKFGDRCTGTWTSPAGACTIPPVPLGCKQQCLFFSAISPTTDSALICPESLSYFNGTFLSDMEATMTAQGVDAGLIAEWNQDAKAWTVDLCTATGGEGDFRVCGPHSSRAGGAAVTKALDPAAWKGAISLEKHMAMLSGYKDMTATDSVLPVELSAYSVDSDPLCMMLWRAQA